MTLVGNRVSFGHFKFQPKGKTFRAYVNVGYPATEAVFNPCAEYIAELREERERKYGVTLMGQLKRLRELSENAEEAGQFSAAINAEKTRSALGGLTTDRRETNHFHAIENMSREEIESRLSELRQAHPSVFVDADYEVINDTETGDASMEQSSGEPPQELAHDTD